jgi:hypothetical protein
VPAATSCMDAGLQLLTTFASLNADHRAAVGDPREFAARDQSYSMGAGASRE